MLYKQEIENCFETAIGKAGIKKADFEQLQAKVKKECAGLLKEKLPLFSLPKEHGCIKEIKKEAELIKRKFRNLVVLGTGGSTLSGQAFLGHVQAKKDDTKIFFLPNVDPDGFSALFSNINLKETCFLVISKSGTTLETISQFFICLKESQKTLGKKANGHFLVITDPIDNPLRKTAKKLGIRVIDHENVGGRFSILTNVGLLPAAVAGLDIDLIRKGALSIINKPDEAIKGATINLALMKNKINSTIMMPYIDRLSNFITWHRQIWAESLGKNGKGTTPVKAAGTLDQHSQLQLYLDGPADKMLTFFYLEKHENDFTIPLPAGADSSFSYIKNIKLSKVFNSSCIATARTLASKGRPVRTFRLSILDEETIGALIMHFIFETVLTARVLGVNPFDQPAVEQGKKLARTILKG